MELKVEFVRTDELVAYANNAKIHTSTQVEQIKQSIREFGFNDPVGYWENEYGEREIVEGHGRVLAALELGIAEVPCINLGHMTDEQRRAYTHVHNKITTNTGLDYELLAAELQDITGFDWEGLGFDYVDVASSSEGAFVPEDFDFDCDSETDAKLVVVRCRSEREKQAVMDLVGGDSLRRMYRVGELL